MKKYYVFDKSYNHLEFDCYQDLLGFLGSIQMYYYSFREYEDYSQYEHYYYTIDKKQYTYYDVYDEEFNLLNLKELKYDISDYRWKILRYERRGKFFPSYYENNYLGFRNGPVPGTGKNGKYGDTIRKPRTTQEIRANQDKEYSRGKRREKTLPDSYDDVYRSNWNSKSWKSQKVRKQWMKKF